MESKQLLIAEQFAFSDGDIEDLQWKKLLAPTHATETGKFGSHSGAYLTDPLRYVSVLCAQFLLRPHKRKATVRLKGKKL